MRILETILGIIKMINIDIPDNLIFQVNMDLGLTKGYRMQPIRFASLWYDAAEAVKWRMEEPRSLILSPLRIIEIQNHENPIAQLHNLNFNYPRFETRMTEIENKNVEC